MASQYKKVIAKSSILIKYKYTLLKQNYKKDQNLLLFGQKIFQNINQFGLISRNNHFKNYLKDLYYKKEVNKSEINQNNNNIQENNYNNTNDSKIINNINENIKEEKKQIINDNNSNQGGIFSTLKYAFGFGGTEQNNVNNDNKGNGPKISEEDKKRMSPEDLWKLEHPGEPEIVYDKELKRYILRGKIYNDQEEVIQKQNIEKPMVPPPKSNKFINKRNNNNDINSNGQDISSNNEGNINQMNNNINSNMNNRINNPFNSSQFKAPPKPPQLNQKQKMSNLMNRYAVGYNK